MIGKRAVAEAVKNRQDIVIDGVGHDSLPKLAKRLQAAKQAGYKINATYVTKDTDQAVKDAGERFAETGRLPPERRIRSSHRDVSRVLPLALKQGLYDSVELYDANQRKVPRHVMSHSHGVTTVHNRKLWQRFLAKKHE